MDADFVRWMLGGLCAAIGTLAWAVWYLFGKIVKCEKRHARCDAKVELLEARLEEYVQKLKRHVAACPPRSSERN